MDASFKLQLNKKSIIEKAVKNYKKSPKERITRFYVQARLNQLETVWKEFMSTHNSIIESTDVDQRHFYFSEDVYEVTEELYFNHKSELLEALDMLTVVTMPPAKPVLEQKRDSCVKLPRIEIPKFSGLYSEWPTFKDLFTSLIHNNKTLDDVQRMHYLKGLLTGEAEQLVRHIPVTSSNYAECWALMVSRYNNKRFLSNSLLKRFLNQSNVTESSNGIKSLLDTTMECLNGLKNQGIDVTSWDVIIIYIVSSKLDAESRKLWEMQISTTDDIPTLAQFEDFLEARFRALEFLNETKSTKPKGYISKPSTSQHRVHHVVNNDKTANVITNCQFCNGNHKIAYCKLFAKESHDSRQNFVQKKSLCFNCLGTNHSVKYCRQNTSCHVCRRRHHSLLHPRAASAAVDTVNESDNVKSVVPNIQATLSEGPNSTLNVTSHFSKESSLGTQVLLATALVEAQTKHGSTQLLRVLLDQGSQASFITESAVQLLGLEKKPVKSVISGIGGEKSTLASDHTVTVTMHSRLDPKFSVNVHAYVLKNITSLLPSAKVVPCNWPELRVVHLADPDYHTPNKINILLGAEAYGHVLKEGLIQGPPGLPVAQNTAFGWILSGKVSSTSDTINCHHVSISSQSQTDDNELLKKFWEIETVIPGVQKKALSENEQRCEEIYAQSTYRDEEGRYVVKLPFRDEDPQCQHGNSRELAVKRFHHLENKFKKNREFAKRYSEVFHEYIDLGHVERVPEDDPKISTAVYLPHHAVVRDDKTTSKVRIVFDASMKSSNSPSLNDDLLVGPMLQQPLRHIIMRWRMYPISICADIVKMYRQVKVAPEDADFQRVLWRDDPGSEIEEYKLVRVTFGTASAPYLAVKTLQQVAIDEGARCPEVAEKIKNDFFVDDLMTGCQTVEEGKNIYKEMSELLTKGGFHLQKWVSSCKELHKEVSQEGNTKEDERNQDERSKDIKEDGVMKILGISWNRKRDEFQYSVHLSEQQTPITKRKVISDISRFFDPLGWAAPCVVTSKIFIQKLWLAGLDWDEELTPELMTEWQTYRNNLTEACSFSIPRWINTYDNDNYVELHGFSDASVAAYAAVVYLRTKTKNGEIKVSLITSRTRVAPVKQQSVPRLELMGAVLLAELTAEVAEVMKIPKSSIHLWTDSTVVLAWLSSHPSRWSTFVGNRVSTVLSNFENTHWAHVQSSDNPGDIASRGLKPQELTVSVLWTQGPPWLKNDVIVYSRPKSIATSIEQRSIKSHVVTETTQDHPIWTKYSTLQKLVRVIAYCRRVLKWKKQKSKDRRYQAYLERDEIQEATTICIKHAQGQEFGKDIEEIKRTGQVKSKSKLKSLCPMIDDDGILRVSGRLERADLEENSKHPIILPHSNHFTKLVIDEAHKKTLHGGPSLMLSHLRTKYWIISAKTSVRAHVRKCITCKRYSAAAQTQLMGQLPPCRVRPARPFLHSGVDFAGPINIRASKGRGHQSYKGYICIFVCMVSKCIHLEAVSDLTANGFIAGFKRFVSRRGYISDLWSDNGTNFVGAMKELRHLVAVEQSSVAIEIREWLGNKSTSWHPIPPHSPNFGGLWEAGVKSTKFHLRRVIGDSTLTYEEISTVLTQIEACLNSRPLSVMPGSPEEPTPLTPGHFLIGEPLITVPDRNYADISHISCLKRWQLTQRMVQEFWRRWSDEYLTHLLQRHKWTRQLPEPKIGDVVLVKEEGLPPARWLLGRVVLKHPGPDNTTRVVTVQCNGSKIKRPLSKLCILPVSN